MHVHLAAALRIEADALSSAISAGYAACRPHPGLICLPQRSNRSILLVVIVCHQSGSIPCAALHPSMLVKLCFCGVMLCTLIPA